MLGRVIIGALILCIAVLAARTTRDVAALRMRPSVAWIVRRIGPSRACALLLCLVAFLALIGLATMITARPALTGAQADGALRVMLDTYPAAFRSASATIRPEESHRFWVDLGQMEYRITIASGACHFDYEGHFTFRWGTWYASQPELRRIAKFRR